MTTLADLLALPAGHELDGAIAKLLREMGVHAVFTRMDFSTSLDAALTLPIADNAEWLIYTPRRNAATPLAVAVLNEYMILSSVEVARSEAATPALAVCRAWLVWRLEAKS